MKRFLAITLVIAYLVQGTASAGVPRGLVLAAAEQTADDATGETVARGNAELTVEKRAIRGTADTIAIKPQTNEIVFTGRAALRVGTAAYNGEAISCSLDFLTCAPVASQTPPAASIGAAETMPR